MYKRTFVRSLPITTQILVLLALYVSAWAFQQTPIPPYPGDDNPSHSGQPLWCQNEGTTQHAANCACLAMHRDDPECIMPTDENQSSGPDGSKCKVWCRRHACRCRTHCDG